MVLNHAEHFPGRERDEREVLGYYAALEKVEQLARAGDPVTERQVQSLHALVMSGAGRRVKATPYRDGQNVIRDGRTRRIVYMPPEAADVPTLMAELIAWIDHSRVTELPCPIRAGIAHYQFATVHPYFDGNGRTARLLTTLILHLGGYDLKGLYSLEEYYARDLPAYYEAITMGPSHNYCGGRAEADVSKWVDYFCQGVADSFESVKRRAQDAAHAGGSDHSAKLRSLDPRQRKALTLFRGADLITSRHVQTLFAISQRSARRLLGQWVDSGFVVVRQHSKKGRAYGLAGEFDALLR